MTRIGSGSGAANPGIFRLLIFCPKMEALNRLYVFGQQMKAQIINWVCRLYFGIPQS